MPFIHHFVCFFEFLNSTELRFLQKECCIFFQSEPGTSQQCGFSEEVKKTLKMLHVSCQKLNWVFQTGSLKRAAGVALSIWIWQQCGGCGDR